MIVLLALSATGCESVLYYGQAIHGQVSILNRRQPIDQILVEPDTPEKLKVKLKQVLDIREFAENELHLPADKNYLSFVALDRPYVVWNVYAAPEFSFKSKTWCFPVVGCTSYRGYFSEKNARDYADKFKKTGLDVYVGPVTAYSTLGWFDDPILSTVIYRSEAGLARLIFHELAHQVLYVKDDTRFNESFATAVEQEGLRRWALANGNDRDYDTYLKSRQRRRAFNALVLKYRAQLQSLYQSDMPAKEMRNHKAAIIAGLKDGYRDLKHRWEGYSGYDNWFRTPINNAKLNVVSTYHELVPAFLNLLGNNRGNLKKFYETCRNLAQKKKAERLHDLIDKIPD